MNTFLKPYHLLIVVAVAIIVFSMAFSYTLGKKGEYVFHEVQWSDSAIIGGVYGQLQDSSRRNAIFTHRRMQSLPYIDSLDTNILAYHKLLYGYCRQMQSHNDTSLKNYVRQHFQLHYDAKFDHEESIEFSVLDKLKKQDTAYWATFTYSFTDKNLPENRVVDSTAFFLKRYHSDTFLAKYPKFGIWALLIIIQATLFILFIPWLLYLLFRKIPTNGYLFEASMTVRVIYIAVTILMFLFLSWKMLYEDGNTIIKPQYFMIRADRILKWMNFVGYSTAALFIAGMMLTFVDARKAMEQGAISKEAVDYLEEKFKSYFIIGAIILTLASIGTSSLFTAISSMDFIKQLNYARGINLLPDDTVVQYGFIHSFLLLVFYLPGYYQLSKLKQKANIDQSLTVPSFMKSFLTAIITASPIIAGNLFKPILDSLF